MSVATVFSIGRRHRSSGTAHCCVTPDSSSPDRRSTDVRTAVSCWQSDHSRADSSKPSLTVPTDQTSDDAHLCGEEDACVALGIARNADAVNVRYP